MTLKWVEKISEFNKEFIKSYSGECDEGYFLEVDVQYLENLHKLGSDLPFLPERKNIEKVDKEEYVIHIRNLKQALNHGLVLKKFHRVIEYN